MVKINKMRLDSIINNFLENIEDLEYAIGKYYNVNREDEMEVRHISKSIRVSFCYIYKMIEDYLGMALKKVGVGINDMTFKNCVNLAYSKNLLTEEIKDYLINNANIINIDSNTYNQPSTEELIDMFNKNKDLLYRYLEFLKSLSNNGFDKDFTIKNSSIFNK